MRIYAIALKFLFVSAVATGLAGCEFSPQRNAFPELTYQHLDPIRLAVGDIVVEQSYKPLLAPPNVEQNFPIPPADAAARWAQDRLVAAGTDKTATVVIREASVVEVALKQSGGITGAVTTEQAERYDARLEVQIVIRDARGWEEASLLAEVTRSTTVPEGLTLNDREKAWYGLTEQLMADMDRRLAKGINDSFQRYLVR